MTCDIVASRLRGRPRRGYSCPPGALLEALKVLLEVGWHSLMILSPIAAAAGVGRRRGIANNTLLFALGFGTLGVFGLATFWCYLVSPIFGRVVAIGLEGVSLGVVGGYLVGLMRGEAWWIYWRGRSRSFLRPRCGLRRAPFCSAAIAVVTKLRPTAMYRGYRTTLICRICSASSLEAVPGPCHISSSANGRQAIDHRCKPECTCSTRRSFLVAIICSTSSFHCAPKFYGSSEYGSY